MTIQEKQSHITMCDMAMVCDLCGEDSWWSGSEREDDFHSKDCPLRGDRDAHRHLLDYEYLDGPEYQDYLRKLKERTHA